MKTLVLAIFFCIGLAIAGMSLFAMYQARQSLAWPVTNAQIIESGISKAKVGKASYRPKIKYRYELNSQVYESEQIYFAGVNWASDYEYANGISKRFPPGQITAIRYQPGKPQQSVLIPGQRRESFYSLILALVFMAFGVLAYYAFHRHETKHAETSCKE